MLKLYLFFLEHNHIDNLSFSRIENWFCIFFTDILLILIKGNYVGYYVQLRSMLSEKFSKILKCKEINLLYKTGEGVKLGANFLWKNIDYFSGKITDDDRQMFGLKIRFDCSVFSFSFFACFEFLFLFLIFCFVSFFFTEEYQKTQIFVPISNRYKSTISKSGKNRGGFSTNTAIHDRKIPTILQLKSFCKLVDDCTQFKTLLSYLYAEIFIE